jgi:hypothetical protein
VTRNLRKPIGVRNQPLPAGVLMSYGNPAVLLEDALPRGSKHAAVKPSRQYKARKRRSR